MPASIVVVVACLALPDDARSATYYVAPNGSGTACSRAEPCALQHGSEVAIAGDTVVLADGIYREPLHPKNSGMPEAWITFRADECALPILEGPGEGILEFDPGEAPSGVASSTGSYLRFIGIVSRYWDSGFTNGWTGQGTTNSNGHFEYINCIGDGNGRTGMVLYSAPNITIRESISAHNGGNPLGSWSSGIQLYAVQGTEADNIIERNVSFENVDAERNSDGSGFIVDEHTRGATFINNLAFRNGGSCMRLTRSDNTRMINFTCYHNGLNPNATGPTNPGEFYFTDDQSRSTAIVINSLAAASGTEMDPQAFMFPPASGLSNNHTIDSGPTPFYSDPEGTNPDFRPPPAAAALIEDLGSQTNAPYVDLGFDPKCITRRDPQVPFQQSWWTHAIDYDYIRSIGGVAECFHPKQRAGGVDIGAYELSGEPHTFSTPGSCVPPTPEPDPEEDGAGGGSNAETPGEETTGEEPSGIVTPSQPTAPSPTPTTAGTSTPPTPTSMDTSAAAPPGPDAVTNGLANADPVGAPPAESSVADTSNPSSSSDPMVTPAASSPVPASPGAGSENPDVHSSSGDAFVNQATTGNDEGSNCALVPRFSNRSRHGAWLAALSVGLLVWRQRRQRTHGRTTLQRSLE